MGQEETVTILHGMTGSNTGKEYNKAMYCLPAYLTYAKYIMQNGGLDESQAGIQTAGRNINNLRYVDYTTLMAESKEELKSLLMKVEKEMATYSSTLAWRIPWSEEPGRLQSTGSLRVDFTSLSLSDERERGEQSALFHSINT